MSQDVEALAEQYLQLEQHKKGEADQSRRFSEDSTNLWFQLGGTMKQLVQELNVRLDRDVCQCDAGTDPTSFTVSRKIDDLRLQVHLDSSQKRISFSCQPLGINKSFNLAYRANQMALVQGSLTLGDYKVYSSRDVAFTALLPFVSK
jgi:hypothetical protein